MALDLDPFDDLLPEPAGRNVRAGAKFQPKAKPQSRKEKHATVPTSLINAAKDTPVTTNTVHHDIVHSVSLPDPSPKLIQTQKLVNSTEVFHPGFTLPDGNNNSTPVNISSQHLTDKEYVDSRDALHSELTISDTHGDMQSGFARPGREAADIFSGLDDFIYESTTANVSTVRKFQPRVKVNAQTENKLPASCAVAEGGEGSTSHAEAPSFLASNAKDMEGGPGCLFLSSAGCSALRSCSFAPTDTSPELVLQEKINSRETRGFDYEEDFLIDTERLEKEEPAFPGLESLNVISQTTTIGEAQWIPSETEYMDDDLDPASADHDFVDFSTLKVPHAVPDLPYEFPASEEPTHHADASRSNAAIPQEVAESQTAPIISGKEGTRSTKRKVSTVLEDGARKVDSSNVEELSHTTLGERPSVAADEGNESGKSSRRQRKKSTPVLADETGGTEENVDLPAEPFNYSLVDEDVHNDGNDEDRKDASRRKRAVRKAKPAVQNEKAGRRCKNSSDGPDSSSKEQPKKKFSHSTRRNRRQLNQVLLETPEDEIDPRKLPLKDLILLGELREQRLKKDAVALKKSLPNQSVNNSFPEDAPYDKDDPFASVEGLNPDEDEAAPPKLNYHSFMKKSTKKRWSKQDTELFYEAIWQFGTDFTMIAQLFPDLDPDVGRRQLVLKYKNEERQHPMELQDALTNRSKDHSHFEMVMEKLQQKLEEQNSDRDAESVGISGEAEDNSPETNEVERKEEVPTDFETVEAPAVSPHEIEDDDDYKWGQDYDDYAGY